MADAFSGILGQPQVRDFLRSSVASDRVTHAYLFAGPAGSNKTQAAYALAQAIICPKGANGPRGGSCGACDNCTRVRRKTHPDIHFYEPEGATGYLAEQVREIVSDVSLAPIQANKKIYIIDRADLLNRSAANAFLKTLEEPPDDVVIILLGRTRDGVLPTISSRCQVVPFRHIPPSEAAGIVAQNTGADLALARQALEANSGSITRAIEFLRSYGNERVRFRADLMKMLVRLPNLDDWDVLLMAKKIIEGSKGPLDTLREKQEEELAQNQDFLAKSAIRQIEERNKRKLTAETIKSLKQVLAIASSYLRDVSAVVAGTPELVINTDFKADIQVAAESTSMPKLSRALRFIDEADTQLDYNVSPETVMDAVLFEVREVFNGASRSC